MQHRRWAGPASPNDPVVWQRAGDILRLNMNCDFQQIQGGQQISIFTINLLASLNLLEKTGFKNSDDVRNMKTTNVG